MHNGRTYAFGLAPGKTTVTLFGQSLKSEF